MQQGEYAAQEDLAGEAAVEVQDHHPDPKLQDGFDCQDLIADEYRNARTVSPYSIEKGELLQEVGGIQRLHENMGVTDS